LWIEYKLLHQLLIWIVGRDELRRRFYRIPGVGPVTALSFMTAIDDPNRFRHSRDGAAHVGLTSRRWQSGTSIDVQGLDQQSRRSGRAVGLYEAASALLTRFKQSTRSRAGDGAREVLLSPRDCGRGGAQAGGDLARGVSMAPSHAVNRLRAADVTARAAAKDRWLLGVLA
jgi:transposase